MTKIERGKQINYPLNLLPFFAHSLVISRPFTGKKIEENRMFEIFSFEAPYKQFI